MIRNNEDRTGPRSTAADEVPADIKQMMNPMDFVAPTEFVELPSKGSGYPEGHPLFEQKTFHHQHFENDHPYHLIHDSYHFLLHQSPLTS